MSVTYWNPDTLENQESKREYTIVEDVVGTVYNDTHPVNKRMTLFLDEDTGIVVHDVYAFETWLSQLTSSLVPYNGNNH
jgi:hypothetical protein